MEFLTAKQVHGSKCFKTHGASQLKFEVRTVNLEINENTPFTSKTSLFKLLK
jgi:hypothetical protein